MTFRRDPRTQGRGLQAGPSSVMAAPGKRTLTELTEPFIGTGQAVSRQITGGSMMAGPMPSAPASADGYPAAGPLAALRPRASVDSLFGVPPRPQVQADASGPVAGHAAMLGAANAGIATPASVLPYGDAIQRSFGRHDISSIRAHTGPEASAASRDMGARAYATGNHVVLGEDADLFTVAHEATHVVQQRGRIQLAGGIGEADDEHERHANAVASLVVQGQSSEALLDRYSTDRPSSPLSPLSSAAKLRAGHDGSADHLASCVAIQRLIVTMGTQADHKLALGAQRLQERVRENMMDLDEAKLEGLGPGDTLRIVTHGDRAKIGDLSPEDFAWRLYQKGLPSTILNIEVLSCESGVPESQTLRAPAERLRNALVAIFDLEREHDRAWVLSHQREVREATDPSGPGSSDSSASQQLTTVGMGGNTTDFRGHFVALYDNTFVDSLKCFLKKLERLHKELGELSEQAGAQEAPATAQRNKRARIDDSPGSELIDDLTNVLDEVVNAGKQYRKRLKAPEGPIPDVVLPELREPMAKKIDQLVTEFKRLAEKMMLAVNSDGEEDEKDEDEGGAEKTSDEAGSDGEIDEADPRFGKDDPEDIAAGAVAYIDNCLPELYRALVQPNDGRIQYGPDASSALAATSETHQLE